MEEIAITGAVWRYLIANEKVVDDIIKYIHEEKGEEVTREQVIKAVGNSGVHAIFNETLLRK